MSTGENENRVVVRQCWAAFLKQEQDHRTQEREQGRPVTRSGVEVISSKWQNNHNCNNANDYFNTFPYTLQK